MMPLAYTIDPVERLIVITGEYAEPAEWRDLLGRVVADPRRQPGFAFLRDLRDATTPVDAATVVGIIEVVRRFWPLLQPWRAAIVTRWAFDTAALTAHALADAEQLPLEAFTSYDAAVAWLNERPVEGAPPVD